MRVSLKASSDWDRRIAVPLETAMASSIELTGRSGKEACKQAMIYMAQSVAKQTKVSPKLRPIVRNPDTRYKTDKRVAPFGVMRWDREGNQYFKPIYRTGEYGKIRFFDKKSASWFKRDANNPKGKWEKIPSGPDPANPETFMPGIKSDKRRIIGRSGLARRSWFWGLNDIMANVDMKSFVPGVSDLTEVLTSSLCGLVLTNRLRYMMKAVPAGAIGDAAVKASNRIMAQNAKLIERKFGIEIGRMSEHRAKRSGTLEKAWKAAK